MFWRKNTTNETILVQPATFVRMLFVPKEEVAELKGFSVRVDLACVSLSLQIATRNLPQSGVRDYPFRTKWSSPFKFGWYKNKSGKLDSSAFFHQIIWNKKINRNYGKKLHSRTNPRYDWKGLHCYRRKHWSKLIVQSQAYHASCSDPSEKPFCRSEEFVCLSSPRKTLTLLWLHVLLQRRRWWWMKSKL